MKDLGLRDKYITMVGGAPCTPRWKNRIGADIYSEDAIEAVKSAKRPWRKNEKGRIVIRKSGKPNERSKEKILP